MKALLGLLLLFGCNAYAKPLPCSNKNTIAFAATLASNKEFTEASKGLDILLSLQSEAAKTVLKNLKVHGAAQSEVQKFYIAYYEEHPIEDNATEKIKYYSCKEIKNLMKMTH